MVRWRLLGREGKGEGEGRRTAKQTNRQTSDHSAAAAVRAAMPKGQRAKGPPHDL